MSKLIFRKILKLVQITITQMFAHHLVSFIAIGNPSKLSTFFIKGYCLEKISHL